MTDATRALPRRALGFLLASVATISMSMGASAPSPFYPSFQERLGLAPIGITVAFAVYALTLLLTLLVAGSISDHIGRRPVLSVGFALLAGSAVLLWATPDAAVLIGGRALQGLASGLLVSTLSATITDFGPPRNPRLAAVLNSSAPLTGLALGAVTAGVLLDLVPRAEAFVFLPLAGLYALVAILVWLVPESSPREGDWRGSLRPRVAVPASARRMFLLCLPAIVAGWATGGLFLSLGASIVRTELHIDGHAGQGLLIGILPATGALSVLVLRRRSSRFVIVSGSAALAVGTALSLVALALGAFPLYLVAIVVAGAGFGAAFMGTIGTLAPLVAAHERAELFAAIYTASYLAFGVPAVVAGFFVGVVGLGETVFVYGIVIALFAAAASILRVVERVSAPA